MLLNLQPKDVTFEYPDIFGEEEKDLNMNKAKDQLQEQADRYETFLKGNKDSKGSPPWFSF